MPKGGRRAGAGRPKGSKSKKTLLLEAAMKAIAANLPGDFTSLDLMQKLYRSEDAPMNVRMAAAAQALPYEHPRLANIDQSISGELGTYAAKEVPVHEREPVPTGNAKANGHSAVDGTAGPAARGDPKALGH